MKENLEYILNLISEFKISGDYYVYIDNLDIWVIDEGFNQLYNRTINQPFGFIYCCRGSTIKNMLDNINTINPYIINDIHIYNLIIPYIINYKNINNWIYAGRIEDLLYGMKKASGASIVSIGTEDDPTNKYPVPLSYDLAPVSKGDICDLYIYDLSYNMFIIKAITGKKKTKSILTVYRKCLKV